MAMLKALRVSKTIISIAILLFVVLVIWGIYTAMNSAAGYTLSQSADALEKPAENAAVNTSAQPGASSSNGTNSDTQSDKSPDDAPPKPDSSDTSQNTDSGTDIGSSTASGNSNNFAGNSTGGTSASSPSSSSSSNNTPSTPSTPTSTYHPAWDEWVVEGHWDDVYVAATYGQRAVYGSICNDCGVDVSGIAVAHLKETHHSGYHEGIVRYEDYVIIPASTDRVWVDTSHWVHHTEYWG